MPLTDKQMPQSLFKGKFFLKTTFSFGVHVVNSAMHGIMEYTKQRTDTYPLSVAQISKFFPSTRNCFFKIIYVEDDVPVPGATAVPLECSARQPLPFAHLFSIRCPPFRHSQDYKNSNLSFGFRSGVHKEGGDMHRQFDRILRADVLPEFALRAVRSLLHGRFL